MSRGLSGRGNPCRSPWIYMPGPRMKWAYHVGKLGQAALTHEFTARIASTAMTTDGLSMYTALARETSWEPVES